MFDELPVAFTRHARGLAALVHVVRLVPEERAVEWLLLEEHRRDILEIQRRGSGHLGQRADGGAEVAKYDRLADYGGHEAGRVTDDEGRAEAAFVEEALARAGGCVVSGWAFLEFGDVHAAVVGSEDHEGILREAVVFEGLHDAADGDVERFDERRVGRVEGLRVGFDGLGRRGQRDVRVIEGEVE